MSRLDTTSGLLL